MKHTTQTLGSATKKNRSRPVSTALVSPPISIRRSGEVGSKQWKIREVTIPVIATVTMASSLPTLIESKQWDAVRTRLTETERTCREDVFLNEKEEKELQECINIFIRSCEDDSFPRDILQNLFQKRRRQLSKETASKVVKDEIGYVMCSFENSTGPRFSQLPPKAMELVLEEHSGIFPDARQLRLPNLVITKWIEYLKIGRGHRNSWFNKEVEEQLLTIQSLSDLKKEPNTVLRKLWEQTVVLTMHGEPENASFLHCAILKGYPTVLIWLASKLYPNQLCHRDELCRVPLHYSFVQVSWPCRIHFSRKFCKSAGIDMNSATSYAECLLKFYSGAATYADFDGALPLTVYLKQAKPFRVYNRIKDLRRMIGAAPQSLKTRDPKSHLLPFMIAAGRFSDSSSELEANCQLEASYNLLRQDPTALLIFMNTNQSLEGVHVQNGRRIVIEVKDGNETCRQIAEEEEDRDTTASRKFSGALDKLPTKKKRVKLG